MFAFRSFAPFCLAGMLAATTCPALDLPPKIIARTTGVGVVQVPCFIDGGVKYTFGLARGMSATEEDGGICFSFSTPEGASLLLKASPLSPAAASFDNIEAYRKQALLALPPGAEEPQWQKEQPFSLSLPGKPSLGFVHTYKLPGRRFIQAVSFVNYGERQQLMFILTAPADGFGEAASLSAGALRSWRPVGKDEDLKAIPAS